MPELQHDRRMVETLAVVTEANAALHLKTAAEQLGSSERVQEPTWSQHEMLGASGLAVAASYWSLLDAERAVTLYRRAAETYRNLKHGYAMALALASATSDEISMTLSSIGEASPPSPQTVAFALVANELYDSEAQGIRVERLGLQWRHFGNVPIGRLGIPLDHYGRCALAMRDARRRKNVDGFFAQASGYVGRAAEVLRSASHDHFNWLGMQSSILPAEPEAVAMTAAMSMMSYSLFGMPISKMPDLDHHGRLLAEVGDDLRKAGGTSKDKPPENNPPRNNPPRNNPPRNNPPRNNPPRENPPMISA